MADPERVKIQITVQCCIRGCDGEWNEETYLWQLFDPKSIESSCPDCRH